ncbi:MAG: 1-deoxy-D-xylulose-5-phosphate reductoisomerase [Bacteroidota bacterium]
MPAAQESVPLQNTFLSLKRHIAILGSTGSIGTQTLEVIREHSEAFQVEALTAFSNADILIQQAIEFKPNAVVIGDKNLFSKVNDALTPHQVKVFAGYDSIEQVVEMEDIDLVVTAMVGFSGLKPTIAAIKAGKQIALSNKETLVVAGELITQLAREKGVNIYPVDSEHSAIFQCLQGEFHNKIEKIYLTASGGPFRGKDKKFLETVTKEQALKHPNWSMGSKITIDSASMMNKGLEMIEAKWLFNLKPEQIDVIIHSQSIIHSIVQFEDGSMKAQMGLPDMKLPIQFAIGYPHRMKSSFPRFDFVNYPQLTFEPADSKTFRNLALSHEALNKAGNLPCILNAANEAVVDAFLKDEIGFLQMSDVIETCMEQINYIKHPSLKDYFETDKQTHILAKELITSKKFSSPTLL